DVDGGDPFADHAPGGSHRVLGLALEGHHQFAAVGTRAVQHEEVGEPGHGDAEVGAWLVTPVVSKDAAVTAHDLHAGEVVRRLETGGHDDHVDGALDPVGVDDPGGSHRGDGRGDEGHVLLLERRVEGRG